jgi:hypothetical protein
VVARIKELEEQDAAQIKGADCERDWGQQLEEQAVAEQHSKKQILQALKITPLS